MIQEEKSLLFQDLCARLPYEVIVQWNKCDNPWIPDGKFRAEDFDRLTSPFYEIKPYLRSMASMTEKEREEFKTISHLTVNFYKYNNQIRNIIIDNDISEFNTFDSESCFRKVDLPNVVNGLEWLNAHHFDYRGLIEKGLALEAPKDMYKLND